MPGRTEVRTGIPPDPPPAGRRAVLAGAGAAALAALVAGAPRSARSASAPAVLDGPAWTRFAERFVTGDGRVVDTGNKGISHSEGQGYGLVLATAARDRLLFDRIWSWTRSSLMLRADGLAAWKWEAGKGVTDANNASDGDLLIAWGLLRAAELWNSAELRAAGLAHARAMAERVVVRQAGLTLPLPGVEGFRRGTSVIVNPSYFVIPAFQALAAADPSGPWADLGRSALVFLAKARFGQWQLPPDWGLLAPDGAVALPDGFARQFGYDAIRVPLYLALGGYTDPWFFQPFGSFAAHFHGGPVPATVSLPGGTTAQVPASVGMLAVYRLAARLANAAPVTVPPAAATEDYYSTVLLLLTRLAESGLGLGLTAD